MPSTGVLQMGWHRYQLLAAVANSRELEKGSSLVCDQTGEVRLPKCQGCMVRTGSQLLDC